MWYALLKLVVQLALKVFYRNIRVQIKGALPGTGPLIVVANHPNTFMDPLVIAATLKQPIHFLTNGSMFKSPVAAWLLKRMNMIPVYRKEDVAGQTPDNRATFATCFQFLARRGTLLIFPEGTSVNERRLQKLKTGTARIALGFEAEHDFQAGLSILTVGLNYSQANRFRSELFINVDDPIPIANFAEAYQADPFEATTALTEILRQRLEAHVIVTRTEAEDRFVRHIATLYGLQLSQSLGVPLESPVGAFELARGIVEAVQHFDERAPERVSSLQRELEDYCGKLDRLNLSDEAIGKTPRPSAGTALATMAYAVLGFPVYAYGLVNNYLPYLLPSKIARLITREEVYQAPIAMTVGICTFTIFYGLQLFLFHCLISGNGWLLAGYALSLPVSAFFALHYWNYAVRAYHHWRFRSIFQRKEAFVKDL